MAMIDYGALLRVDGVLVNKDKDLFMDVPDYVCESAEYNDEQLEIAGQYFVYAGDEHFFIAFYKTFVTIVSDKKVLKILNPIAQSETFFFKDYPTIKVSHLDKNWYSEKFKIQPWREFVRETWENATGNEKLNQLARGKEHYISYMRWVKRLARINKLKTGWKQQTRRYLAEWDYKGKHYEVIFGYGIDPCSDEKFRISIANTYGYTPIEKAVIDGWFKEF